MKRYIFLSLSLIFLLPSCQRTSTETWEDVKTAGRYLKKSVYSLFGGEETESKQLASTEDFIGPNHTDFLPLNEQDLQKDYAFTATKPSSAKQVKENRATSKAYTPDHFDSIPQKYNSIFRTIHFNTDDHVVYDHEDLVTVAKVANFMKKHPNATLIIEGHTDKRASADYNMALGMRRAHHIKVLLSKQGVASSRVYTTSFGKEKPVSYGDSSRDYQINRRAEFKLNLR